MPPPRPSPSSNPCSTSGSEPCNEPSTSGDAGERGRHAVPPEARPRRRSRRRESARAESVDPVSRPGVLLDRDGTIIADRGYVGSVDRVEFLDGAIEGIAALNRADLPVAVVTNQAGVARGYYGIEDVDQVHKHMIEEMARHGAHVDLWLFCPYHPDGTVASFARTSADRKPGPGMGLAAAQALGLDLASSWVVGDSASDVGLARAVGATPLHVGPAAFPAGDILSFPDLAAAAEHILRHHVAGVPRPRPAFPYHQYTDGGSFGSAYTDELARALGAVD